MGEVDGSTEPQPKSKTPCPDGAFICAGHGVKLSGIAAARPAHAAAGVRLGLSNIVTMYALFVLGPVSGYTIAVLKSLFVLLTRGAVAACMSVSGGLFSVTVMLLLGLLPGIKKQYLLLSVFGGASHNIGQLIAARFIINNFYVWYYLPVLLAAGLLMGAVTGLALRVILPYLNRLKLK